MTDWEPATEAEAALRDALRAGDQELYFRILSHVELLLPMSSAALSPRAGTGWGTWTSGGRTHVLAFTSPQAMTTCLAEHGGAARRMAYADLAGAWPNPEVICPTHGGSYRYAAPPKTSAPDSTIHDTRARVIEISGTRRGTGSRSYSRSAQRRASIESSARSTTRRRATSRLL